jgi:hypothetical protein
MVWVWIGFSAGIFRGSGVAGVARECRRVGGFGRWRGGGLHCPAERAPGRSWWGRDGGGLGVGVDGLAKAGRGVAGLIFRLARVFGVPGAGITPWAVEGWGTSSIVSFD